MPIVSCLSIGLRDGDLGADAVGGRGEHRLAVPTQLSSANSPANPPMPPSTSGRLAFSAYGRSASTARSPASMSTPAAA